MQVYRPDSLSVLFDIPARSNNINGNNAGNANYNGEQRRTAMNRSLTIPLALVAGLAGGFLTRYIAPPVALAQNQAPVTKEIRAQNFTLVDPMNRTVGTFTVEPYGNWRPLNDRQALGRIVLLDSTGHEIWNASGIRIQPLSENVK